MTRIEFEERLRELLRSEPFQPFHVELADGRSFAVEQPDVVFNAGIATYWAADELIDFSFQEVRSLTTAAGVPT